MWVTVLITPLISSKFSCWSLYFLSCDLPFWLPLWYLQTFLLVIVFPVMWYTVLITPLISSNFSCWSLYFLSCDLPFWLPITNKKVWRYQRGNQNGKSHDRKYNDQQEKFEDIKGVIRTVTHMRALQWPTRKVWRYHLWFLQTFLVGHCISCLVIYRSDYTFDILKLFL
jgi:hypothetical protein